MIKTASCYSLSSRRIPPSGRFRGRTSGAEKTVYRGRLFLGSGPTTQGVVSVEITVDHMTTSAELAGLPPLRSRGRPRTAFSRKPELSKREISVTSARTA